VTPQRHATHIWTRERKLNWPRAGYDGTISIEHEDALISVDEGFRKSVAFLRQVMPSEPPLANSWWTH
jgi:sugar phosphate isomerase/epimerase